MVVRREALEASGWTARPLLEDRIGQRVVSGGDVEMVARVAGQGYELWYAPECRLRHVIPGTRASRRGVLVLVHGLGSCSVHHDALWWTDGRARFLGRTYVAAGPEVVRIGRYVAAAIVRRRDVAGALFDLAFLLGRLRGAAGIVCSPRSRRDELFGAARRGAAG
jgi:hypothetical protein